MTQDGNVPPSLVLLDLLSGMLRTQAVHQAAVLGIAELVKDGPRGIPELAKATQTRTASLARLLRALESIGIFAEVEPEIFSQTPLSALLRPDVPESMYAIAMLHGDGWQWRAWEGFALTLETGKPAFGELFGKDMWTYFKEDNPAAGRRFQNAMTTFSEQVNRAIATAYDFGGIDTLVDIGGGEGTMLVSLLMTYPTIRKGILFDRPEVVDVAHAVLATSSQRGRCELVAGDFFESVPAGADAYFMKQIIKDWDEQECVQILSNCRKAMRAGGRVLVVETVLQPGRATPHEKFIDLQLMVLLPGQERYEEQFRQLFEKAGFALARIVPTASPYSILEGVAV